MAGGDLVDDAAGAAAALRFGERVVAYGPGMAVGPLDAGVRAVRFAVEHLHADVAGIGGELVERGQAVVALLRVGALVLARRAVVEGVGVGLGAVAEADLGAIREARGGVVRRVGLLGLARLRDRVAAGWVLQGRPALFRVGGAVVATAHRGDDLALFGHRRRRVGAGSRGGRRHAPDLGGVGHGRLGLAQLLGAVGQVRPGQAPHPVAHVVRARGPAHRRGDLLHLGHQRRCARRPVLELARHRLFHDVIEGQERGVDG